MEGDLEPTERQIQSQCELHVKYLLEHLRKHAYKKGTFTLASGKTSDFYIDCKKTFLRAHMLRYAGDVMNRIICDHFNLIRRKHASVLAVAGTGVGGGPLAASVAIRSEYPYGPSQCGLDMVYVRSAKKDHGTKRIVEGSEHLFEGAGVVLVEDVTTTGGSALRAIEALREAKLEVKLAITLVDRLEGASVAFSDARVPFARVFSRDDFVSSE